MKTYLADLGWGTTYSARSIREARQDKQVIGVHEYRDGRWFRTIWFAGRRV